MMMTIMDKMSSLDLPLLLTWMPSPTNTCIQISPWQPYSHMLSTYTVLTRGPQCSSVDINNSTKDEEFIYVVLTKDLVTEGSVFQ